MIELRSREEVVEQLSGVIKMYLWLFQDDDLLANAHYSDYGLSFLREVSEKYK